MFTEIRDIVQEVAALYHAGSKNAVLNVRTGDIALAVRSAIGDLLHLVHQIPYVDPAAWSVESVVTRLGQAEKGLALYKKISPHEHYIRAARGSTRASRPAPARSPSPPGSSGQREPSASAVGSSSAAPRHGSRGRWRVRSGSSTCT